MPQKRNPDAAELVRAKVGAILGALVQVTVIMKGLPLAYGKDMQEDKVPLFQAFDALDLFTRRDDWNDRRRIVQTGARGSGGRKRFCHRH